MSQKIKKPEESKNFSLQSTTKQQRPRLAYGVPFLNIKEKILGKRYELSLVFVGDTRMRALNEKYRKKNATTDILSFPISKNAGEIFISQKEAARRSKKTKLSEKQYLTFLYIHGLLHLSGHKHGKVMEILEKKWCKTFNTPPLT